MNEHYVAATKSVGSAYLGHEAALRLGGQLSIATLTQHLQDSDPVDRLMARVLLQWAQGQMPGFDHAIRHLDGLQDALARTPASQPRPSMVQAYLSQDHGPQLADFVALRLVKQDSLQPWRVYGYLLYLEDQRAPSTTQAIIRFAVETRNESWRQAAIEALGKFDDPDLLQKIEFEAARAKAADRDLPPTLNALARTKSKD